MGATATDRYARKSISVKRTINWSLCIDMLEAAKPLGISISQVCDPHVREVVRREPEHRWRAEHAAFMAAHNATLEAEGLPLDAWSGV